jgi:hypothetical protein
MRKSPRTQMVLWAIGEGIDSYYDDRRSDKQDYYTAIVPDE